MSHDGMYVRGLAACIRNAHNARLLNNDLVAGA